MVSDEEFEACLDAVARQTTDPSLGLFGPDSITWMIDREAILFLGAARAALLQTAHPFVAEAIVTQSRTLTDPVGRFQRTFMVMFSMVFGRLDQALAKARALRQIHDRIRGRLAEDVGPFPKGTPYSAHDRQAMIWVHATLVDTSMRMYELLDAGLSMDDKNSFYRQSRKTAALFGLSARYLPDSWDDFSRYMDAMYKSDVLSVGTSGLKVCEFLLYGKHPDGRRTFVALPEWYRAISLSLLPREILASYRLTYGDREARHAQRALKLVRRIYPLLPKSVRYVPPYHEACGRIAGVQTPGVLTRALNRMWVGQTRLVS